MFLGERKYRDNYIFKQKLSYENQDIEKFLFPYKFCL